MARFTVTGMNWAPLYVSPVPMATIWCLQVHLLELVSLMDREEENGQGKTLFANVRLGFTDLVNFVLSTLTNTKKANVT